MTDRHRIVSRSVEFRSTATESDGRTLEGYASVWNQATEIDSYEGKFVEQVARGAFVKTLAEGRPILQYDHGRDPRTGTCPIGVFKSLQEDPHGLHVVARLFANQTVEPIIEAIREQAITGMSFRFKVLRDEWRDRNGKLVRGDEMYRLLSEPGERGPLQRTIREVQLFECGPVVSPAYSGTSVGVRSLIEANTIPVQVARRRLALHNQDW